MYNLCKTIILVVYLKSKTQGLSLKFAAERQRYLKLSIFKGKLIICHLSLIQASESLLNR